MGSNNTQEIGKVDSDHIASCLDAGDDFSFEMQVLNLLRTTDLRKVDLRTEHGGTYIDPVSGLARQFDIRARLARESIDNKLFWRIRLAVECKQLHSSAPLVVSRSKRTAGEAFHSYISANYIHSMINSTVSKEDGGSSLYSREDYVGRSLNQIRAGNPKALGDSDIYVKWSQALASVDELVWESLTDAAGSNSSTTSVALPFLVIPNGTLWVVDYDSEGRRSTPIEAESCEFYFGKPASPRAGKGKFVITHLHICTMKGLQSFLNRLNETEFWLDHFPQK